MQAVQLNFLFQKKNRLKFKEQEFGLENLLF